MVVVEVLGHDHGMMVKGEIDGVGVGAVDGGGSGSAELLYGHGR